MLPKPRKRCLHAIGLIEKQAKLLPKVIAPIPLNDSQEQVYLVYKPKEIVDLQIDKIKNRTKIRCVDEVKNEFIVVAGRKKSTYL